MKIIGLTGGIASGKSTVSQMLMEFGYPVLDADKVAWEMAEPHQALWQAYVDRYGEAVLHEDMSLNRQAVASIVFRDAEEKKWMDAMAHPLIKNEILQRLDSLRQAGCKIAVLDVPLLYESGWDVLADEVWVVYVNEANQLRRLCQRNGFSEEEAKRRISVQMPMGAKRLRADVVIDNNGTLETLQNRVMEVCRTQQVSVN